MQKFKETDALESRVIEIFNPTLSLLEGFKDEFYEEAYKAYPLGDVFFNLKASPLADAVTQETFRRAFYSMTNLFTRPGTFEFYLEVIEAVWGDNVAVNFVVPSPGVLQINIEALDVELSDFLARKIVNNVYEYDEVMDHEGNNIAFQGTQGIKTQSEADALFYELYPAGIIVQVGLIIS